MQKEPLVTIIMPIYRVEKYIKDSVNSVIRQTYKNIELILVDDGSPDNSICYAKEILDQKEYDYILIRQENKGLGEARNAGLKVAKGEWIFFLDSDDLILDSTIESLIAISSDEVDIVFSNYREIKSVSEVVQREAVKTGNFVDAKEIQQEFLIRRKIVLAPGTLFRKSLLNKYEITFDKIAWSEDQHFVWRVLRYSRGVAYTSESLYQYLRHGGSIMSDTQISKMVESYYKIIELPQYYYQDSDVAKFLVPRWTMGTLNSAATTSTYQMWKVLFEKIEGKKNLKILRKFPDKRVRVLSLVGIWCKRVYYILIKWSRNR